ncbi:putative regulator of Ras-like GTPase activity (Roadblock/LC7/MglB family) [Sporosarcina luteola]|nr:putative regulator of Ras-like GTPase activity (Roadblock/LC7/MglB family) [Sporosarcina luteola]
MRIENVSVSTKKDKVAMLPIGRKFLLSLHIAALFYTIS